MKIGDVVIYKEFGREFPALVLSTRELEHHGGENDEPLINLAFVKEVKNGSGDVVNVSGTVREAEQIQFRHDIAHESHAFSDEAKEQLAKAGLLPPGGSVSGGRYVEAVYLQRFFAADPAPVASTEGEALTGAERVRLVGNTAVQSDGPADLGKGTSVDSGDAGSDDATTDPEKETVQ